MSTNLLHRVRNTKKLPALPSVTARILELMKDDQAPLDAFVKAIRTDASITANILKLVNSAYFGLPRRVASIDQAVSFLGLRSTQVLVLSLGFVEQLRNKGPSSFDYNRFWRRSLTTAVCAKQFALATKQPCAEEAFLAGLLSDLGVLAGWFEAPEQYASLFRRTQEIRRPLNELEEQTFGLTHAQFGAELLMAWSIPESICAAVAAHHGSNLGTLANEHAALAKLVFAAANVAAALCRDVSVEEWESLKRTCCEALELDEAGFDGVLVGLHLQVDEVAQMLRLELGEGLDYERLQAEVAAQLAQATIAAELQRVTLEKQSEQLAADFSRQQDYLLSIEDELKQAKAVAAEGQHLKKGMQRAAEIQRGLLPAVVPFVRGMTTGCLYRPAELLSGDFYDFIALNGDAVAVVVGDVAGHGVEAGIVMSMAKTSLGELLRQESDPADALCKANEILLRQLDRSSFVSVYVVVFDPVSRMLRSYCAGHNPPLLLPCDGSIKREALSQGGFGLGLTGGKTFSARLKPREYDVAMGDLLLIYTDGLIEARNAQDEQYGLDRLAIQLRNMAALPADEIADGLLQAVDAFRGPIPQDDDMTGLCLKFAWKA